MRRWPCCSPRQPWRGDPSQAVHPFVEVLRRYRTDALGWPIREDVRCIACGAVMTFAVNYSEEEL